VLPFSASDYPLKLKPYPVDCLSNKVDLDAVQLAFLEEMIEKGALVAFQVAKTGNKAGRLALLFDRHLHEFSVSQEAVHAGEFFALDGSRPGRCWLHALL